MIIVPVLFVLFTFFFRDRIRQSFADIAYF